MKTKIIKTERAG